MNIELWRTSPLRTWYDDLELFRPFGSDDIEFFFGEAPTLGYPAVEVKDDDKNYYLEAETPGLTEKELEVAIEDGVLELTLPQGEEAKPKRVEIKGN